MSELGRLVGKMAEEAPELIVSSMREPKKGAQRLFASVGLTFMGDFLQVMHEAVE